MEIRTRYRAVTADDFEFLAAEASLRVARVVCIPPQNGEAIRVRIARRSSPDRRLSLQELTPPDDFLSEVSEYLDERRLIGTNVQVLPCRYRGVVVVVDLTTTS